MSMYFSKTTNSFRLQMWKDGSKYICPFCNCRWIRYQWRVAATTFLVYSSAIRQILAKTPGIDFGDLPHLPSSIWDYKFL